MLTVTDVSVRFNNSDVLKNISLTLEQGDFLGIIGPNGSGKTVLLRALLGEVAHQGTVSWDSSVRIGYVPQHLDLDKYITLTLGDFLKLKINILRLPASEAAKAIGLVGLSKELLARPISVLSGGQLQRGLIAFALLGKPTVLLFDEPTASVDTPGEERIYELLHRLQDEYGLTIILVSHELDLVSRYADKVLCLNREMICYGSPASLKPEILDKLYGHSHKAHVHELK